MGRLIYYEQPQVLCKVLDQLDQAPGWEKVLEWIQLQTETDPMKIFYELLACREFIKDILNAVGDNRLQVLESMRECLHSGNRDLLSSVEYTKWFVALNIINTLIIAVEYYEPTGEV
ncbi:MAG: hypothetical protein JNK26_00415 [Candidatus Doudnabacteria bacterium]|nr:hypothetical protein [Candidatus Doudnabacteria bacterium]